MGSDGSLESEFNTGTCGNGRTRVKERAACFYLLKRKETLPSIGATGSSAGDTCSELIHPQEMWTPNCAQLMDRSPENPSELLGKESGVVFLFW